MFLTEGLLGYVLLAAVTFLAGAINSVAGGGTILTFPLLTAILPDTPSRMVLANVTSTLGLFPSAAVSTWAYRRERENLPNWARWLFVPCLAGAIGGAGLLIVLPPEWFERLVPWLILSAAVLFAVQPQLSKLAIRGAAERPEQPQVASVRTAMIAQFFVSLYGGYFGAGMGIVMLAMLGALGLGDIHKLNGVKNLLAMLVNGMAAVMLATLALIGISEASWVHVALMAITGSCGSLSGSLLARRMPAKAVRKIVAAIGFGLAAYYMLKG
jgi:uncharacterized membrane protein YfcA